MSKKIIKTAKGFIPLAIVITALCGLVYVAVQQSYRQNANDPQIQMAEDAIVQLQKGASASALNASQKVDLNKSLSPFYIVFDAKGQVAGSNADLDGKTPTPPSGVFNAVGSSGGKSLGFIKKQIESKIAFKIIGGSEQNRLTWEPKKGVRIASVIVKYKDGYVLAGRSLREVEAREEDLMHLVFIVWIVTLGAAFIATFVLQPKKG